VFATRTTAGGVLGFDVFALCGGEGVAAVALLLLLLPPPQPAIASAVSGSTAAVARKVMGFVRVIG
jgi:hypothetical protein